MTMASKQHACSRVALSILLILAIICICLGLSSVNCTDMPDGENNTKRQTSSELNSSYKPKPHKAKRPWFQKLLLCKSKDKECNTNNDDLKGFEIEPANAFRPAPAPAPETKSEPSIEFPKPTPHPDEIDESPMSAPVKRFRQLCREEYALAKTMTNLENKWSPYGTLVLKNLRAKAEERIDEGRALGINWCPDDIVNIHGPVVRPKLRQVDDYIGVAEASSEPNLLFDLPRPTPHPDEIDESSMSAPVKRFRQLCRDEYALSNKMTNLVDKWSPGGDAIASAHTAKVYARIKAGKSLGLYQCPDDIVKLHGPVARPST